VYLFAVRPRIASFSGVPILSVVIYSPVLGSAESSAG